MYRFSIHKVNLIFRYNNSAYLRSPFISDVPKLFRHFARSLLYCRSLLLSRVTRHSLPSPLLCQNSLFLPISIPFAQPSQLSRSLGFHPTSASFHPPPPPLSRPSAYLSSSRSQRLTFLTKSKITFVTRNSARPNPCIELTLSFYFQCLFLFTLSFASLSFSRDEPHIHTPTHARPYLHISVTGGILLHHFYSLL